MSFWKWILSIFGRKTTTTTTITDTTTTKESNSRKRAFCTGLNDYPGTSNDLKGCVSDSVAWTKYLAGRGFVVEHAVDSTCKKEFVVNKLQQLAKVAKDGLVDKIVWTNSSHGTSIPDTSGDEPDGRDEAICLYDGLLVDDEIRGIIDSIPPEVEFVLVSDSCHSGTVTREFLKSLSKNGSPQKRYMPPEDDKIAVRVMSFRKVNKVFTPKAERKEVLLAGCKSDEYSYDTEFQGTPRGAFSYYALKVLIDNPDCTYGTFYEKMRRYLPTPQLPQTPQLECSDAMKNTIAF